MRWLSVLTCALAETIRRAWLRLRISVLARSPAQGLVEYGLILVLIMVVCVAILATTGETISEVWYHRIIERIP